jgi:hypothetical protein
MSRNFLLFLLVIASHMAAAQAPGYMGKRLSVNYSLDLAPAFLQPNSHNKIISSGRAVESGIESSPIAFNLRHTINADYATGRHTSVGGAFTYYKTRLIFREVRDTTDDPYGASINYGTLYPGDSTGHPAKGDIRAIGIGFYIKYFGKKYIAPWGVYSKFEFFALLTRTTYKTRDFDSRYSYQGNYYYGYPGSVAYVGTGDDKNMLWGIAYTKGKQRILGSRVIFDYGLRIGYIFGTFDRRVANTYNNNSMTEVNYIKTVTALRLFKNELVNVRFAFGLLR